MTTKSQEAFEEALKNKPEAKMWNAHDLMLWTWNQGGAYGRKQALEEAVEICESTKQGGINGHMAATRCANQIKELIK